MIGSAQVSGISKISWNTVHYLDDGEHEILLSLNLHGSSAVFVMLLRLALFELPKDSSGM